MKKKRFLIYFCIGLSLSVLIGVSFFYLRKLNALEKFNERVDHSYQVIIQTNQLEKNLLNAETGQRGYLLTKDPAFLESYLYELKGLPSIFLKLDYLTSDNYRQQKNLDTLREVINLQLEFLKSNLEDGINDSTALYKFRQSNVFMNKIRDVITQIRRNEGYLLAERTIYKNQNNQQSRASSFLSIVIAFALVCIAAVTIIWFFNRNERYRADLEDKLEKLTSLNLEIQALVSASAHNLQEPMRKVQVIIDRLQHSHAAAGSELNEQLGRVKEIYNKQLLTNATIVDYFTILLAEEKKETIALTAFIQEFLKQNYPGLNVTVGRLGAIEADAMHLELLLKNIINNSIQFSHPERELHIAIQELKKEEFCSDYRNKNFYGIGISDNGKGIEPEYLSKIFELFQKIESSGNGDQRGMGLSFCRRIMLNHEGRIRACTNSPYGLCIQLYFPQKS